MVVALNPFPAASQDVGQWDETLAPMPTARQEIGVGALQGKVYVIGGFDDEGQSVNTVARYDPALDAWEPVPDLPAEFPLNHVNVSVVGDFLYVLGGLRRGFSAVDTVFCFDPSTDTWSPKMAMPSARGSCGVAAIGAKIYVAGGIPGFRNREMAVYDTIADQWTELSSMPTGRDHLAAAAVDGKFYAFGGRTTILDLEAATEVFDPVTNTWEQRAPIPTPRGGIAAAAVGALIYVFGGEGNPEPGTFGVFDEVEQYDPVSDGWASMRPMATPRHGIGAAAIEGKIYIPGGGPVQGFGVTKHHDAFYPPGFGPPLSADGLWRAYD